MEKITFSVVITVRNEEDSISALLDSLINQTELPGEIIVVDGGSDDRTTHLIDEKSRHSPLPIRLFHRPGLNRSQGRNYGIEQATSEYIAVTDAGCEADFHWLQELAIGFVGNVQVVAGFYLPIVNSPIQRLFAAYVATSPEDLNEATFLPSSRSLAFKKTAWEAAGRYPELLTTCEDLVFADRLKKLDMMVVRRHALVYWRQADGVKEFFRQIKGYAYGDVQAGYMPHVYRIGSTWIRYVLFFVFPPLFLVYLLYPFSKHWREVKNNQEGLALPWVQVIADWAVMIGSLQAVGDRISSSWKKS